MKKSIIGMIIAASFAPAAFANTLAFSVNNHGDIVSPVVNPANGVRDIQPATDHVTLFGSDQKVYDLDQIQGNLNLIQDHQNQIAESNIKIAASAADIAANKTTLDNHGLALKNLEGHVQSVDNLAHDLHINNIQDRQELADHDASINTLNSENTRQEGNIQHNATDIAKNASDISGNTKNIAANAKSIADNKTTLDNHGLALKNLEGHVQSVDNLAHDLHINNIQDRQELADHDASINTLNNENTRQEGNIQHNATDIAKNATDVGNNAKHIATNTSNIAALSAQTAADTQLATKASHDASTAQQSANDADRHAGEAQHVADSANQRSLLNAQNEKVLARDVQVATQTGTYAQARAQAAFTQAEANRQAMATTSKTVAAHSAELANHEQRIEKLESENSGNFGRLKSEVDDNRQRASAGIAGVAAMANIPQVTNTQNFSVGAGVGNTDGESALAVGFSARATQNVVVKASVSNDTQHNFVVGGGVSYGW